MNSLKVNLHITERYNFKLDIVLHISIALQIYRLKIGKKIIDDLKAY